jgi:hypothetical protein
MESAVAENAASAQGGATVLPGSYAEEGALDRQKEKTPDFPNQPLAPGRRERNLHIIRPDLGRTGP